MDVNEEKIRDVLVLEPVGRVDASTADALERALLGPINRGETRILVDFSHIGYISSAGLRVFLLGAKRLGAKQGKLALCSMEESIRKVFEIAGFARLIPIHESREAALHAMSEAPG